MMASVSDATKLDDLPDEEEDLTLSLLNDDPRRDETELEKEKKKKQEDDEIEIEETEEDPEMMINGSDPATSFPIGVQSPDLRVATATTELTSGQPSNEIGDGGEGRIFAAVQQQRADEARKLFQRLWTDEDEIELLQGFLEYTNQRGATTNQHHYDTALFYDQIKSKLQLEFNKNQLVEKLRRLKKKYRNVVNRIRAGKEVAFKSPHDQATFEISSKIWTNYSPNTGASGGGGGLDDDEANISIDVRPVPNYCFGNYGNSPSVNYNYSHNNEGMVDESKAVKSRKRSRMRFVEEPRDADERFMHGNSGAAAPGRPSAVVPSVIEETVRSCLSPMFKDIMDAAVNGPCVARGFGSGGFGMMSPLPLSFGNSGNMIGGGAKDERWRRQQIRELEVYSRRLELVQDEIQMKLQELRSAGM